jgi:cyanophycin synthetase
MGRFKKLMLKLVASTLSPSQISSLRDEFNAIDKAMDPLQPGDLCLVLIDQVEDALAYIGQKVQAG